MLDFHFSMLPSPSAGSDGKQSATGRSKAARYQIVVHGLVFSRILNRPVYEVVVRELGRPDRTDVRFDPDLMFEIGGHMVAVFSMSDGVPEQTLIGLAAFGFALASLQRTDTSVVEFGATFTPTLKEGANHA